MTCTTRTTTGPGDYNDDDDDDDLLRFILDLRLHSSPCAVFIFHVAIMGLWKVFGDVLMHLMSRYERFPLSEVDFWRVRRTSSDQAPDVLRACCPAGFLIIISCCTLVSLVRLLRVFHMFVLRTEAC